MNTPISWIKAYVPDLDCTTQEYVDKMTLSGSNFECYEELNAHCDKIVVGQIKTIEKHPDADKLRICQVDIGESELLQIVTAATNVNEGDKVPVVLAGGKVFDKESDTKEMKIKKGKLRGVESFGMFCGIEEFGAAKELYPEAPEDGVYIFDEGAQLGADAIELLGRKDVVVEFEITSNRVDCFSMIGMAREVAATFNKPFHKPVIKETGSGEAAKDYISVEIKDTNLCKRYVARVVKDIKIAPSPVWMQRRLAAMGIRPINNIVDITNYVMEEYGQPMHAFDLSTVEDNKIIVKTGEDNTTFTTLDGQERNIDSSVLMICDGKKEIAIAGIMGGENSMVTDNISTLLLESACFDGTNIRLSSKKVGLRTDASGKFEKGLDPNLAMEAMNRACELIEELGAGTVLQGAVDVYPEKREPKKVPFEPEKINGLLGTNISKEEMLAYFKPLELEYDEATESIIVPTFRQDLECMADLAEEVARFYGYDNIPVTLPKGETTVGKLPLKIRVENIARNIMEQNGFNQGMTYSFESPKVFDKLGFGEDAKERKAIVISNPLGEDYSVMRTTSLNGMLTSLATNYNRRNKAVRLYELGNVYIPEVLPLTKLPDERMKLTMGMFGAGDFFTLKGVVEELFDKLGVANTEFMATRGYVFLHPGRQASIMVNDVVIGYIGQVHPEVSERYGIEEEVYIAVLDMPHITELADFDRKFTPIAKFPATKRDLSMVVKQDILVGEIEKVLKKNGGKFLESIELFDVYQGEQVKEGYKSVAYSITFRASDHTLEDSEINPVIDKIVAELGKLDIELRM